jgi:hypothetical protein
MKLQFSQSDEQHLVCGIDWLVSFSGMSFSTTIPCMFLPGRGPLVFLACFLAGVFVSGPTAQQLPATPGKGRTLLLPRRIVSGERATLAVLDANGRLTPGASVNFSNGDRFTTDATGRALFVAPLNPGVILGSITGRNTKVPTAILSPTEVSSEEIEVSSMPQVASLTDRFEIIGKGFCGNADANHVTIGAQPAFVLASSPASLIVLPLPELQPGSVYVEISCGKRQSQPFSTTIVQLELEADSSPLKPGERRVLTVRIRGTDGKIALEAGNLAPEVAEISGGNPARAMSSGGAENAARFEVLGRKNGSFLISIRLVPVLGRPH